MTGLTGPVSPSFEHDELVIRRGRRTGAPMVIAVHSGLLGVAVGPAKLWVYDSIDDAIGDALSLSANATASAVAAGCEIGGAAGVIALASDTTFGDWERTAVLHDFGEMIESLEGRFIATRDVGLDSDDMVTLSGPTRHLAGLQHGAAAARDPAPVTALGVEAALRAAVEHRIGPVGLARLHVTVIGLGQVGRVLAQRLVNDGSRVTVTDLDLTAHEFADRIGAEWVDPHLAPSVDCDALLPCAPGISLRGSELDQIAASIVCGASADFLADRELAEALAAASVLYVPPELSGAGGTILAAAQVADQPRSVAIARTAALEEETARVLADARTRSISPSELVDQRRRVVLADARQRIWAQTLVAPVV